MGFFKLNFLHLWKQRNYSKFHRFHLLIKRKAAIFVGANRNWNKLYFHIGNAVWSKLILLSYLVNTYKYMSVSMLFMFVEFEGRWEVKICKRLFELHLFIAKNILWSVESTLNKIHIFWKLISYFSSQKKKEPTKIE